MSSPTFRIVRAWHDRRGVVAVVVGLAAPVLVMAVGIGVEVSRWSVAKVELQRIADAAALAGAFDDLHQSTQVPQTAAQAAARLAQINGIAASTSPKWTAATNVLSDNQITVTVIPSWQNTGNPAVQVTVSRSLPLYLAHIFTTATSQTVSATAVAALQSTTTGMACLLALQGDLNGLTTSQDVSASNGVHVGTQDCALRSDAGINLTGGASVDGNVIAAGQVAISNGASVTPPFTATSNAGQVADPFIGDAAVQSALQAAADASGPNPNCTGAGQPACSLSPGNFTGISVSNGATLTLQPGLYTVKGAVNFGGGTVNIMPGGVTIVSSGSVSISNGVSVNGFAAATPGSTGAANGAIPGVLLATSAAGSNAAAFSGGASFVFSGVMYVPNGTLSISNGVSTGSPGCAEAVAYDVNLTGGANFASGNCSQSFGSSLPTIPGQTTTTAVLVQ
jgi:Flp pilus assembly protein TadG